MQQPSKRLTDPGFIYRSAAATDVTLTWRKFGWTPKSEQPVERLRIGDAGMTWFDEHGNVTMHLPAEGTFTSDLTKPSPWASVAFSLNATGKCRIHPETGNFGIGS